MKRRLGQMERRDLIAYIRELEERVMLDSDTDLEDAIYRALVRFEEYKSEKAAEANTRYLQAQIDYTSKFIENKLKEAEEVKARYGAIK